MARKKQQKLTARQEEKLDAVKLQLCLAARKVMKRERWGYQPIVMAGMLGTTRARITHVQIGATKRVSFNQLFRYLVQLAPTFEIIIAVDGHIARED